MRKVLFVFGQHYEADTRITKLLHSATVGNKYEPVVRRYLASKGIGVGALTRRAIYRREIVFCCQAVIAIFGNPTTTGS